MIAVHPSNIKMAEQYCQYAIKLLHENVQYDRQVFQTGIAAHYMLEVIGNKANELQRSLNAFELEDLVEEICKELINKTRYYDGVPEPPVPLADILEAKLMVLEYTRNNDLPHDANYEEEYALDKDWNFCDYNDPNAIFRTIIDMVHVYKDEDDQIVAHVKDYKSSWYITGLLDNIQRKAQAVVVWMKYNPDILIMDVTSIRTGQIIQKEIICAGNGQELNEWSDFIQQASATLCDLNKLIPQPGLNCYNCPYASSCQYVVLSANRSNDVVHKYTAALAVAKSLEKQVKEITKENNVTQGNTTVGYVAKESKSIKKGAITELLNACLEAEWDIYTFIEYLSINRTQANKIMRDLPPEQRNKVKHLLINKVTTRFGVDK